MSTTLTPEQAEVVARIHATPAGQRYTRIAPPGTADLAARWADKHDQPFTVAARKYGSSKTAVGEAWRRMIFGGGR